LQKIRELLASADTSFQRRAVLWGVGGAGKTQLAIQYALRYEDEFSAVFYINAKDEMTIRGDCFAIATSLKFPEAESAVGNAGYAVALGAIVDAVKEWFVDHDGDWLLIVDNANNLESFDLEKYLPATKKGHVIITSQDRSAAGFGFGPSIEVGEMVAQDAHDLFLKRSGHLNPTQVQREACQDIVSHLGHLALAVEHAAAYVQSMGMPMTKYLENLQRNLKRYLMRSPPGSLHKDTVQATLAMAFEAVRDRNKVALELLSFLAYIDNEEVFENLLLAPSSLSYFRGLGLPASQEDLDGCKRILLSFSLIGTHTRDDGEQTLSMHSLVHRGIRLLFGVETQWVLLSHSAVFIYHGIRGKPSDEVWFPSARLALKLSTELFQQQDHGEPPENAWVLLSSFLHEFRVFWQAMGLMHELDNLCCVTIQALSEYHSNNAKVLRFRTAFTRFITVQFTIGPEAGLSMMTDFLIENMIPAAAISIRELHQTPDRADKFSGFQPCTLGEVFTDISLRCIDSQIEVLKCAAMLHLGRPGQRKIGAVYLRLSQLPIRETWMTQARRLLGMINPLSQPINLDTGPIDLAQCAAVAAQHRAMGDLSSTITVLSHIIERSKPLLLGWPGAFETAVLDQAKLLLQLRRFEEASRVIQKLEYPSPSNTEASIAKSYRDFYVWVRKIHAKSMALQQQHSEAEAILKETYETAGKVFGKATLGYAHAGLLLEQFYLQPCSLSTAKADELRQEYTKIFAEMYCGRLHMRLGEGLIMGKILLSQGGIEEAVKVFEHFAAGAERLWGEEDPMVKRARKWEEHARKERSVEIRDEVAGRPSLAWSCLTFPRDPNALGVE
jgi:hypothetical protein